MTQLKIPEEMRQELAGLFGGEFQFCRSKLELRRKCEGGSDGIDYAYNICMIIVIYTIRGDTIRLISARRATRQEAKAYEE